jgi:serine kinase of HPr protein (carbohydrate metabolism regulator)
VTEIERLEQRIERMYELQIPFFIVDREMKKLRELREEVQSENNSISN